MKIMRKKLLLEVLFNSVFLNNVLNSTLIDKKCG